MKVNFSLLFYLKKPPHYQSGPAPIYLRLTVAGQRAEVSTGRECEASKLNAGASRFSCTKETIKSLNRYLDSLQSKVATPMCTYQYKPKERDDSLLNQQLQQMVEKRPSIGFLSCFNRIRRMGHTYNHKRVYRVYTALQLNIRRRSKKRLPAQVKQVLFQSERINQVWSVDFMSDSLWDGRKLRLHNIVDDYNREILSMEADLSIPALRVIRLLEYPKAFRGLPEMSRVDNGPQFISQNLEAWCQENKIRLVFIQPGKPMQDAYIERCNGSIRREILNAYVLRALSEVRQLNQEWRFDYNHHQPHHALNFRTPVELLKEIINSREPGN